MFVNVGMCQQAVTALLKVSPTHPPSDMLYTIILIQCTKVAEAVDVCVQLNEVI